MRCGNSKWGYRHIAHRWSRSFEGHIKATLVLWDKEGKQGEKRIYCLKVAASEKRHWFKVVWTTAYVSTDHGIHLYIITATWDAKQSDVPADQKTGCAKIK
ncbi:hypothetical protein [Nonomuraea turcica]|uniref:hypothetical protein n=1 Tax=Nonomuraea sp. G32 TaxID=3067274 RepID=UPI00273C6300|nr:hypothetical protein [Nonomuraea sp. G32]MDP4512052.1 hypothetical protein [Nonomuraea sp. G32]